MTNLYMKMGLGSSAVSESVIKSKLAHLGYQDRFAIEQIILNKNRRDAYDRTYIALKQIGKLRALLNQEVADDFWGKEYIDFEPEAQQNRAGQHASRPPQSSERAPKSRRSRILLTASVILFVAAILFWLANDWDVSRISGNDDTGKLSIPTSASAAASSKDASEETSERASGNSVIEERSPDVVAPTQVPVEPLPPVPIVTEPIILTPEQQRQKEIEEFRSAHQMAELPGTGIMEETAVERLAPFELMTRGTNIHYYVKLAYTTSGQTALTAFVRAGERLDIDVPLGSLELKYATGSDWYGIEHLFGPETSYYRADETFHFRQTTDSYLGYTVELYLQVDGNLKTDEIEQDAF
jgi:hypothetical protein